MSLPAGFRYAAAYAGIRKVAKDDLALIVSDTPASAAAVFTQNRVVAAPVELARTHLRESRGRVRACLVNAGNANCATRTGDRVALESVRVTAKTLGVEEEQVLPASTGVIGVEMNGRLVVDAMPEFVCQQQPNEKRIRFVADKSPSAVDGRVQRKLSPIGKRVRQFEQRVVVSRLSIEVTVIQLDIELCPPRQTILELSLEQSLMSAMLGMK